MGKRGKQVPRCARNDNFFQKLSKNGNGNGNGKCKCKCKYKCTSTGEGGGEGQGRGRGGGNGNGGCEGGRISSACGEGDHRRVVVVDWGACCWNGLWKQIMRM